MVFTPQIEGAVPIRSGGPQFGEAFRRRVQAGLLTGHPHWRSKYEVTDTAPDRLAVRAADWWAAINVGLNDLDLDLGEAGSARYRVRYWRWASYGIALCGVLGVIGVVGFLTFDIRGYIARHPNRMLPGLSDRENLAIGWVMILFWGFVWPWIMIAFHKPFLRGLVVRLIKEVDGHAMSGSAR